MCCFCIIRKESEVQEYLVAMFSKSNNLHEKLLHLKVSLSLLEV